MKDAMVKERCDCPPAHRLRPCADCPWPRGAKRDPQAEELGLDIPTFLRRQGGEGPRGGGCCGR
jgi:hypothetical protein